MFHAEVRRDCAPWDGDAFSVSISTVGDVKKIEPPVIHVSIWQTPNLKSGGRFTFPDSSKRIGAAVIEPSSGSVIQLRGTVSFTRIMPGETVEGEFDLLDPGGRRYVGRFSANWTVIRVGCG